MTAAAAPRGMSWETMLGWGLLGLALPLSCLLGVLTPYLIGVLAIVATIGLAVTRQLGVAYSDFAPRAFLAAFLVLAICFAITAKAGGDLRFAGNFLLFALFGPLYLLMRKGAGPQAVERVARLSLAGVAVALAVAVVSVFVLGQERAGSTVLSPIRLSDTATILGFWCLMPMLVPGARLRPIYFVAPLMAIVVALLSGSRGPLLALPPLTVLAVYFLARRGGIRGVLIGLACLVGLGVLGVLALLASGRSATLVAVASQVLSGGGVTDNTTSIRLVLYEAGLKAFADAPWFGHGWARLMSSISPYLANPEVEALHLPQLHNDVLNMAVAAGLVGVGVYFWLLVAPIAGVLRTPRDSQFVPRLYGALVLVVAYVGDGLTDVMFGLEYHTALYAAFAAIIIGYCRDAPVSAASPRAWAAGPSGRP